MKGLSDPIFVISLYIIRKLKFPYYNVNSYKYSVYDLEREAIISSTNRLINKNNSCKFVRNQRTDSPADFSLSLSFYQHLHIQWANTLRYLRLIYVQLAQVRRVFFAGNINQRLIEIANSFSFLFFSIYFIRASYLSF